MFVKGVGVNGNCGRQSIFRLCSPTGPCKGWSEAHSRSRGCRAISSHALSASACTRQRESLRWTYYVTACPFDCQALVMCSAVGVSSLARWSTRLVSNRACCTACVTAMSATTLRVRACCSLLHTAIEEVWRQNVQERESAGSKTQLPRRSDKLLPAARSTHI